MKSKILTICEKAIIDQASNNASLINIIEELRSKKFPFYFSNFNIFALFQRDSLDKQSEKQFINLKIIINNEEKYDEKMEINFMGKSKTRWIIRFQGIPIENPGGFQVKLLHEGKEIANYEIEIESIISKEE